MKAKLSTAAQAIHDGLDLRKVVNPLGLKPVTFIERVVEAFAQPTPIVAVAIEDGGGSIRGGVLFIRGERNFELIASMFTTAAAKPDGGNAS